MEQFTIPFSITEKALSEEEEKMVRELRSGKSVESTPERVAEARSIAAAGAVAQMRELLAEANLLLNQMQLRALKVVAERLELQPLEQKNEIWAFGLRCDQLCMEVVEFSGRLTLQNFYGGQTPGEENALLLDAEDLLLIRKLVKFLYPLPTNVHLLRILNSGKPQTFEQRWSNLSHRLKAMDVVPLK